MGLGLTGEKQRSNEWPTNLANSDVEKQRFDPTRHLQRFLSPRGNVVRHLHDSLTSRVVVVLFVALASLPRWFLILLRPSQRDTSVVLSFLSLYSSRHKIQ